MPLVWSVPEALVAAELATAFPSNSGYVTWVTAAFGPRWGFMEGFISWLSSACDNAIYPVLFCDYLRYIWPSAGGPFPAAPFAIVFALVLSLLSYRGLNIVGWSAFALAVFTMLPFFYIVPVGLAQADPRNFWIRPDLRDVDWNSYLNVLFWNLNYWDTASTLAGEVAEPRTTFPRGLLYTSVLVFASYLLPLVAGVGMLGSGGVGDWRRWTSGTLALVGERTGGPVIKAWVVGAAAVSNIGQFISEQVSAAYQLQGMAELGWLPACFGRRSRHGTPSAGLALGLVVISGQR